MEELPPTLRVAGYDGLEPLSLSQADGLGEEAEAAEAKAMAADFLGPAELRRKLRCAFGFEVNPRLTERLCQVEAAYNSAGWRTLWG